ncbi:Rieske (2Fe-2S) protein [Bordetella genomosp. 13]|uniref:Rieske (2Fe-2S) protein n=1 Tax=Bordetella genomosp. 13 TaxID=463040 RepID=UPI0011A77CBD|nr:Rieske 2Fe-2S domain-containing protein [Bordetella genomosp. 13]
MTEPTAVRVCRSDQLVDGGLGIKVPAQDRRGPTTVFFVRYQGRVYGYLNRCLHMGVAIDWEGSFFTREGDLLMCARHGATFAPDTGACMGGLNMKGNLSAVSVEERQEEEGGVVYWLPDERIRPAGQAAS